MPLYQVKDRRPVIGEGSWVAPSAELIGDVRIGRGCYVGFGAVLRGDYGTIEIGDESAIEECVMIHARPFDRTVIGTRVTVGHMAMIHNAVIHDNAIIGMKSMVSDFSEIGEWALIAEMSLVVRRQKVPSGKIYGGSPSKEMGDIQERHKIEWGLAKQLYADLAKRYNEEVKRIDA